MKSTTVSVAPATENTIPELLTAAQVGELTHMKSSSLAQMRYKGTGPKFVKLGNRVLYRRQDVTDWINGNVHSITGEAA